jgi:hypothetical protein
MNKPITTALLILVSGLSLSTTALAESFNHGSAYVNYRNYDDGPESLAEFRKRQSDVRFQTNLQSPKVGGFNDRGSVEDRTVAASPIIAVRSSADIKSSTLGGFNDLGLVDNEAVTVQTRTIVEAPISKMISTTVKGFNDRG